MISIKHVKSYEHSGLLMQLSLLAIVILLNSCTKGWLDKKTDQNLLVPSTLKDFEALLDNTTVMNDASVSIGEIASDGHYISEGIWNTRGDLERNAYTWTNERLYSNVQDWNDSYKKIFYCNLVIEGLDKIATKSSVDITRSDLIRGNALFHRGRIFFELIQVWGPSYNPQTSSTDLGIPVRLHSDVNIPTKRSTLKETYEQIISDLLNASELLHPFPEYKTRGSKASAFALLAKAYLIVRDFEKAKIYADSSLLINSELIDYNSIPVTQNFVGIFNKEVLFHSRAINYTSLGSGALVDPILYNMYDTFDLRKTVLFKKNTNGTITFKGRYDNITSRLFTGIATDEVFLIRAECNARLGNISGAISDLNTLLVKRWKSGKYVPFTVNNPLDALKLVIRERKKELTQRCVRWSDLKRLNMDSDLQETISRTIGGKTYILEPNSFRYAFPIPTDIIQRSSIQQNPGW